MRETSVFCRFCAPICTFPRTITAKSATFNSDMSFVFNYLLASVPLFSNKSFVFSYFLASFQQASFFFNNILASFVVYFVIFRLPFPARACSEPLSPGHPRAQRPATTKCLQSDHDDRLSYLRRLVKRKMLRMRVSQPAAQLELAGGFWLTCVVKSDNMARCAVQTKARAGDKNQATHFVDQGGAWRVPDVP